MRDRWDMISGNLKAEGEAIRGEEAPIAAYERMVREQKGEGLKFHSLQSQTSKA